MGDRERLRNPKSSDHRILLELMKNAQISDTQLAKAIRTSKSNVSRKRTRVEKEFIEDYIAMPKLHKIGFEIIAFTFVKSQREWLEKRKLDQASEIVKAWVAKHPSVVFASDGEGMGFQGVMISFHKSYSEFVEFKRQHDIDLCKVFSECRSFIADLNPGTILKPFHLKYLAEAI